MGVTVAAVARSLGGVLEVGAGADADTVLDDIRSIEEAGPEHLAFVANRRYARHIATTRAGVLLLDPHTPAPGRTTLRVPDPYLGFARALALFHPYPEVVPGVHPSAVVDPTADVTGAAVGPLAVVGAHARVGPGTRLEPGAVVGAWAVVGRDCRIGARAVVGEACVVGDRVVLNPGAVVGSDGFGFATTPDGHVKIPQVGRVVLEDDVELGACTCVDRAAVGETRVRRGAKLDNLVQVGHGATVGEHALLVACSGVAGSSRLGRFVTLAARASVLGHLEIGDGVQVGAASTVTRNLPDGARVSGHPAFAHALWRRAALSLKELPGLLSVVRRLDARVAILEAHVDVVPRTAPHDTAPEHVTETHAPTDPDPPRPRPAGSRLRRR
ncbi:MAG: UDP-3-O-(3-hydroxymyristoyl)glucosamine N-acyltransferase [Deltaproteobacteria bacterium]|nr:UDP-3-O-(3-hydroxymyristoyl)glucosamine N-acyltransferase [Deltaproteobacteria bacterium]